MKESQKAFCKIAFFNARPKFLQHAPTFHQQVLNLLFFNSLLDYNAEILSFGLGNPIRSKLLGVKMLTMYYFSNCNFFADYPSVHSA